MSATCFACADVEFAMSNNIIEDFFNYIKHVSVLLHDGFTFLEKLYNNIPISVTLVNGKI